MYLRVNFRVLRILIGMLLVILGVMTMNTDVYGGRGIGATLLLVGIVALMFPGRKKE